MHILPSSSTALRVRASIGSLRFVALLVAGVAALAPRAWAQRVISFSAGNNYSMFVKADGTLWGTGYNGSGQLGNGKAGFYEGEATPVQVATEVAFVSAGYNHVVFIKTDGTVWTMGDNFYGELCDGTTTERHVPTPLLLVGSIPILGGASLVSAGNQFTIFQSMGLLAAGGWNAEGQLGDRTNIDRHTGVPVPGVTGVTSVSAGTFHTVFIKMDGGGSLWAMGGNSYGQLGLGSDSNIYATNVPIAIPGANLVSSASAGWGHTAFVMSLGGTLWTAGWNSGGQLGDGTKTNRPAFVPVASGVESVAAGYDHTMFVKSGGTLWGMGNNYDGRLGDGTTTGRLTPVQTVGVTGAVASVAVGSSHTLFLKKDGTLWGMGSNLLGQLGVPTVKTLTAVPVLIAGTPATNSPAATLTASSATSLFTESRNAPPTGAVIDATFSLASGTATLASGTVSIMGNFQQAEDMLLFTNDGATMGNIVGGYNRNTGVMTLTSVGATATVAQWQAALRSVAYVNTSKSPTTANRTLSIVVDNGSASSAAVTKVMTVAAVNDAPTDITLSAGTIYQGGGTNAVVGTLSAADPDSTSFTYTLVSGTGATNNASFNISGATLQANNAAALAPGNYSVRIQADDGSGGTFAKAFAITVVAGSDSTKTIVAVATGDWDTLFLKADGTLWGMGYNASGQLGDGSGMARYTPVQVASGVASVAAGSLHSVFVKTDGSLWAMGSNLNGQLGDGTTISRPSPVQIATGVASVAAGGSHTMFVKTDRTLWAVGNGSTGQLGTGTAASRSTPVQVATNVAAVAAGDSHTVFLKTDGTLWGTGLNGQGELGDGSNGSRLAPEQVATGVASIAAGSYYTLFVKTDGSLWATGDDSSGQLGNGSTSNRLTPVQIATGVASAVGGGSHTFFVKTDGTLWATGQNSGGQLGNGTTTSRTTPVQIATGVTSASAGSSHTAFIKTGGTLWTAGDNSLGELGDGTTTNRSTPVQVSVAGVTGPVITAQPASLTALPGQTLNLSVAVPDTASSVYEWRFNGTAISGATGSTLTLTNVQPANAGLYTAAITSGGTTLSEAAIVGVWTTSKVIGNGAEIARDIYVASNNNTFDQVLPDGAAVAVTADSALKQITRTSFIDLSDDIVQIEMSGPGTLSLVLANPTGPALPVNYNQTTSYMRGHPGIVITGATEDTNVSAFSVGRITAVNQALFKSGVTYDGLADVAFIAIASSNGKFGGVRTANASYFATKGLTGVYAPGVAFSGPVFVGDLSASDAATPVIILGSAADTRITGGDLLQANGQPVKVAGITQLKFTAGSDSHGNTLSAKANRAVLQQNGSDVTAQLVVNP